MPWRPEDARPMSRKHGREGGRSAGRSRPELPPATAGTSAQILSKTEDARTEELRPELPPLRAGTSARPELPPPGAGTSALSNLSQISALWLVTYPFGPLPINRHLPPPS